MAALITAAGNPRPLGAHWTPNTDRMAVLTLDHSDPSQPAMAQLRNFQLLVAQQNLTLRPGLYAPCKHALYLPAGMIWHFGEQEAQARLFDAVCDAVRSQDLLRPAFMTVPGNLCLTQIHRLKDGAGLLVVGANCGHRHPKGEVCEHTKQLAETVVVDYFQHVPVQLHPQAKPFLPEPKKSPKGGSPQDSRHCFQSSAPNMLGAPPQAARHAGHLPVGLRGIALLSAGRSRAPEDSSNGLPGATDEEASPHSLRSPTDSQGQS
eukprot:NODE_4169_length_832_cov_34.005109_g3446_i0.p1 GENE.NODE_4169_length_832_cov_34.005109_g3446_i0~~NODE_4169_length_832_cov_34.005109_g3446_i0.p1  ORF type:complete len:276 (+),score=58.02 NODE_4169_length_832_cov_34.005109_g3446_i0:40-828(+)